MIFQKGRGLYSNLVIGVLALSIISPLAGQILPNLKQVKQIKTLYGSP